MLDVKFSVGCFLALDVEGEVWEETTDEYTPRAQA